MTSIHAGKRIPVSGDAAFEESASADSPRLTLADQKVEALREKYGDADGLDLLTPLIKTEFPGRIMLASSFGVEAAVLLDLVAQIDPETPVVFIDTGKLFEETYTYLGVLSEHLGLKQLYPVFPASERVGEIDPQGDLWQRDMDACCHLRKVEPLAKILKEYDAWITGRKRFHGDMRSTLQTIENIDGRVKINPLATWSPDRIAQVFRERKLPPHPLAVKGYTSVGCHHCTHRAEEGEGLRSGRWAGHEKTECGIHRAPWARQSPEPLSPESKPVSALSSRA